ncbi:hypothetical protein F4604DRAFT_1918902 [Suillus subluteus]|nr:hypothetical protein F4604DRAFT_1918902 [Suillus subluteus]
MAPPRWTSADQLLWLQNELPTYLQTQKEKKLTRFFESLFPKWFNDFPEETELNGSPPCIENTGIDELGGAVIDSVNETAQPELINTPESAEQEGSESNSRPMQAGERRKQLREWFRNNSKGKTTPGSSSTGKALSALLGQRARGTRDLKEVEVYSKLHYESKVKPLVSDALKNNPVQPTQRLSAVRQHTTDCFADESEEVKNEIREETARLNAARRLGDVAGQNSRTKEEVYHAIQELPIILGQIFEDLSILTGGWHYTLVMGGADPLCEGNIMTLSYHHGKTADGLSFKASTPNFHEQYLLPFERHLGRIHGASSKSMLPVTPSSTPTSPCLPPADLISLDGILDESSLRPNQHLSVLDPSLDFDALAGMNEHGEWSMRTSHSDWNTIVSPQNMTDTPITAWRKSTALNEDPLIRSPTFNRTQWPGVSIAGPSVEAIPPFILHPLSSFHTTLLPQPTSLSAEQMNRSPALQEVDGLSMLEPHFTPLPFNQLMFNLGLNAPSDPQIPLPLLPTITQSLLPTSTAPESTHSKSTEHQPPSAPDQPTSHDIEGEHPFPPAPHQPTPRDIEGEHQSPPAPDQPTPRDIRGDFAHANLEAGTVSVDQGSLPTSRQLTPCDIGGVLAGETPQPSFETGTVSLLPVVPTASNRRTRRPPRPSTRAAEANKIGHKQGTKPTPKRKQTEVQRSSEGPKKKSRK